MVATRTAAAAETTPAVANATIHELVEHIVTDMLLLRQPGAEITRHTPLAALIPQQRDQLAFLFEVQEALGWPPTAGFPQRLVLREVIKVGAVVTAFVAAAPEPA